MNDPHDMHRFLFGVSDRRIIVDHWNRNGLDNRRVNLRVTDTQRNSFNQGARLGSTSRFKGVSWSKDKRRWVAQITVSNQNHLIGRYHNEIEAAIAYDAKAVELFGPYALLTFPEGGVHAGH